MLQKQTRYYTSAEYLALEDEAGHKSEYFQGEILIDQERIYLEYYHKLEDGRWMLTLFNRPNTNLTLTSIKVRLPIDRIYHKVDWSNG